MPFLRLFGGTGNADFDAKGHSNGVSSVGFGGLAGRRKEADIQTSRFFPGFNGVSQLAYLSGFLDALYYFENKGPLDSVVTNCLFDDESANKILSVHVITARNAVREAKKRGDKDFSVVDALVVKLKQICPKN